jgi:membrane dipeptidase
MKKDPITGPFFGGFVMAYPIFDAHADFLMNLRLGHSVIDGRNESNHISLPSLIAGNVKLEVFAAFVGDRDGGHPTVQALEQILWYRRLLEGWGCGAILPVTDLGSLDAVAKAGTIGALLSVEGGEAASGSILVLELLHSLGVRLVTLLWNQQNEIGHPAVDTVTADEKLKPFGRECIGYMNRHGMAVDVSHLNAGGFWDALLHSEKPVIASHSNAHALCRHPRNVTDDQIRAIIACRGFIGLNFASPLLNQSADATVEDIVLHALHILELGGEDVLGFGSDFDGIEKAPIDINGAQDFPAVMKALEKAIPGRDLLERIAYRNFRRFLTTILPS